MIEKVLDAFEGLTMTQPLEVNVRLKDKRMRVLVGFGELFVYNSVENCKELEEKYDCKVVNNGRSCKIVPNVVGEVIEKDGFIASYCEDHRKLLREWFENKGVSLLREILGD